MLHNNIAVKVTNLGKAYRIGVKEQKSENITTALVQALLSPLKNFKQISSLNKVGIQANDSNIFWANRNLHFEVKQGEVLGIIGKNGAGKSTLLKMLSRIVEPTEGKIELFGRVASLLEVGTGFNPELTGRENIFLNGTILGLTKKEIEQRFDSIVDFSGIEKFIDTPVKRYSSGMKVRLAFAVAAHLEPEILIIDEVLAVGDAEFQRKCLGKMQEVANNEGRTVLFVSHDMAAVKKLCTRAILLQRGNIITEGKPEEVVNYYLQNTTSYNTNNYDFTAAGGNKKMVITSIDLLNQSKEITSIAESGQDIYLRFNYEVNEKGPDPVIIVHVRNNMEQILFSCISRNSYSGILPIKNKGSIICHIPKLPLLMGTYSVDVCLKFGYDVAFDYLNAYTLEVEKGDFFGTGKLNNDLTNGMIIQHIWLLE